MSYYPDDELVRTLAARVIAEQGQDGADSITVIAECAHTGDWPELESLDDGQVEILFDEIKDAIRTADLHVAWP